MSIIMVTLQTKSFFIHTVREYLLLLLLAVSLVCSVVYYLYPTLSIYADYCFMHAAALAIINLIPTHEME